MVVRLIAGPPVERVMTHSASRKIADGGLTTCRPCIDGCAEARRASVVVETGTTPSSRNCYLRESHSSHLSLVTNAPRRYCPLGQRARVGAVWIGQQSHWVWKPYAGQEGFGAGAGLNFEIVERRRAIAPAASSPPNALTENGAKDVQYGSCIDETIEPVHPDRIRISLPSAARDPDGGRALVGGGRGPGTTHPHPLSL